MNKKSEKTSKEKEKNQIQSVKEQKKEGFSIKQIKEYISKLSSKYYIDYPARVIICSVCFLCCMLLSFFYLKCFS